MKIPFYIFTLTLVIFGSAAYFFSSMKRPIPATAVIQTTQNAGCITSMNIVRLKDFNLTKPILLADVSCESDGIEETKGAVIDVIHQQEQYGNVATVSFYLRKLTDGSWTTINAEEQYAPGSLMKVPILISYLKEAEDNSTLLDKQIIFSGHDNTMSHRYPSQQSFF